MCTHLLFSSLYLVLTAVRWLVCTHLLFSSLYLVSTATRWLVCTHLLFSWLYLVSTATRWLVCTHLLAMSKHASVKFKALAPYCGDYFHVTSYHTLSGHQSTLFPSCDFISHFACHQITSFPCNFISHCLGIKVHCFLVTSYHIVWASKYIVSFL